MNSVDGDDAISRQIVVLGRDVAVLTARYETINGKLVGLDTKFDALVGEISRSRQTPWPMIISGLMAAMVMIGGGWAMINLQTENTVLRNVNPLQTTMAHLQSDIGEIKARADETVGIQQQRGERISTLEQQSSAAAKEREAIAGRVDRMAAASSTNGERITALETALVEVETQFCALSDQLNYRFAAIHRLADQLWRKLIGQPLSDFESTPRIGRCGG